MSSIPSSPSSGTSTNLESALFALQLLFCLSSCPGYQIFPNTTCQERPVLAHAKPSSALSLPGTSQSSRNHNQSLHYMNSVRSQSVESDGLTQYSTAKVTFEDEPDWEEFYKDSEADESDQLAADSD
ncbi:hypothetical protein B0H13DRAFT_1889354 [Mycena leptocephala]|nr:hypothetical protein B0H13DRAFT_1889354 [Mycena leptocephala]